MTRNYTAEFDAIDAARREPEPPPAGVFELAWRVSQLSRADLLVLVGRIAQERGGTKLLKRLDDVITSFLYGDES